jgi:hypothetical protein
VKEILVKIAPWLALVMAFFGVMAFMGLVGLGSLATIGGVATASYGSVWQMWVSIIALGIMALIYVFAFNPLRNRQKKGWEYMYYAQLISVASSAISLNIFGAIVGFVVGFWILFQVREKYS